jgi:hypothetical protein
MLRKYLYRGFQQGCTRIDLKAKLARKEDLKWRCLVDAHYASIAPFDVERLKHKPASVAHV